jgi:hypothetical protein
MPSEVTHALAVTLSPEEIPAALRLVSVAEAEGKLSAKRADVWRLFLAAWYGYYRLDKASLSPDWDAAWAKLAEESPPPQATHFVPADSDAA